MLVYRDQPHDLGSSALGLRIVGPEHNSERNCTRPEWSPGKEINKILKGVMSLDNPILYYKTLMKGLTCVYTRGTLIQSYENNNPRLPR